MTKEQRAEMRARDKAYKEAEEALNRRALDALHFTNGLSIKPDVAPPESSYGDNDLSVGWSFNAYTEKTSVGCSSSVNHSIGRTDRTTTQRPLWLYSSRLLALKALRGAMEMDFARRLAKIDIEIEKEMKEEKYD